MNVVRRLPQELSAVPPETEVVTTAPTPGGGPAAAGAAPPELNVKRLIRLMIIIALGLMLFMGAVAYAFREPLLALSKDFVANFHGPGVALGFFIPDAFTIPLPNDAFTALGVLGGMGFWEVVMWGTLGSLVGGSVGWLIGRGLARTAWFKRQMAGRGAEINGLIQRYGTAALAVAALTPLPYSLACWACGAGGMKYRRFILVSLLRFIRVALYLYLVRAGIVTVLG